ncbi:alpha/beta hydrolase [Phenylobacterium sp. LjRoot225]|uniref:alpha/beta hydrolase n=1 Tax=Phenylobacterium sp. LjRoot225 TaxID=3342285 RepID=UPI003ECEBE07
MKSKGSTWRRRIAALAVGASLIGPPALAAPAAQALGPTSPSSGQIPTPAETGAIPLLKTAKAARYPEQWAERGKNDRSIRNVSNPTLTPFLPDPAKATGAAVIVAPGGAFFWLSIDSEGYDVARWLADHGVAAFVLKYRTQETPRDPREASLVMAARMKAATMERPIEPPAEALEDAKAAVRLVRARASEWRVDPARVGFAGFSAGAIIALSVGLTDDASARPDFIAPIYPPMSARPVPADAPPMFLAIALDDPLFAKGKSLGLIDSWRSSGRPIEVHLYGRGGHGFGMNSRAAAPRLWIDEFHAWMKDRGLLRPTG